VISGNTVWQANTAVLIDVEAIQKEDDQIVLSPNDSLTLFSSNLNTVLSGIFLWRERHLEESELV